MGKLRISSRAACAPSPAPRSSARSAPTLPPPPAAYPARSKHSPAPSRETPGYPKPDKPARHQSAGPPEPKCAATYPVTNIEGRENDGRAQEQRRQKSSRGQQRGLTAGAETQPKEAGIKGDDRPGRGRDVSAALHGAVKRSLRHGDISRVNRFKQRPFDRQGRVLTAVGQRVGRVLTVLVPFVLGIPAGIGDRECGVLAVLVPLELGVLAGIGDRERGVLTVLVPLELGVLAGIGDRERGVLAVLLPLMLGVVTGGLLPGGA